MAEKKRAKPSGGGAASKRGATKSAATSTGSRSKSSGAKASGTKRARASAASRSRSSAAKGAGAGRAGSSADGGGSSGARRSGSAQGSSRNGLTALDAVQLAREHLTTLLGRPIESVLSVDRDHSNWIVTAQVVELARIPNTTDVLGEYEAVLDRQGEVVNYHRTHRYHRGHVDSGA